MQVVEKPNACLASKSAVDCELSCSDLRSVRWARVCRKLLHLATQLDAQLAAQRATSLPALLALQAVHDDEDGEQLAGLAALHVV